MRSTLALFVILTLAAAPAVAQKENVTERYLVEIDAGFLTQYDDSDMWNDGYDVGIAGLWARNAATSICARFSISHWSYAPQGVVNELVPDPDDLLGEQSTGQLEILTLVPMVRYDRDRVLGKLGAFIEAGAGIAYVKTFALTELTYNAGVLGTQVASFELNETDWCAEVVVGAGFSREVSTSSWIDLIPTYRAIFTDETAHVVAISIGFRLRV